MNKVVIAIIVIIVIIFGTVLLISSNNSIEEAGSDRLSSKALTSEQAGEAEEIDLQSTDDDFSALDASLDSLE